jgi:RNA polymerase sigma-70 factor, ECF subfamily
VNPPPSTDADDWGGALAGDGIAFARIFERHHRRIHQHGLRLVPTPDDAKDVVAITFLEAWRKRGSVRFVGDSLLPSLSRAHQEVVALCVLQGFAVADAAEVLGVPEGTVKSRLHWAKRRLADRLQVPDLAVVTTERIA